MSWLCPAVYKSWKSCRIISHGAGLLDKKNSVFWTAVLGIDPHDDRSLFHIRTTWGRLTEKVREVSWNVLVAEEQSTPLVWSCPNKTYCFEWACYCPCRSASGIQSQRCLGLLSHHLHSLFLKYFIHFCISGMVCLILTKFLTVDSALSIRLPSWSGDCSTIFCFSFFPLSFLSQYMW